jgi:hypothetical protein
MPILENRITMNIGKTVRDFRDKICKAGFYMGDSRAG